MPCTRLPKLALGHRLRHQLVDATTAETVESHDKGRAYEIGAHQFLPVEQHEIDAARAAAAAPPPTHERPREAPGGVHEIDDEEDEAEASRALGARSAADPDQGSAAPQLGLKLGHALELQCLVRVGTLVH